MGFGMLAIDCCSPSLIGMLATSTGRTVRDAAGLFFGMLAKDQSLRFLRDVERLRHRQGVGVGRNRYQGHFDQFAFGVAKWAEEIVPRLAILAGDGDFLERL